MMFAHTGVRALWPTIFFLPWFSLGIAYLLEWLRQRRSRSHHLRGRLRLVALGFSVAAASLAHADPVAVAQHACPVSAQEQARALGDELFEQGAYQRAGECYQAANEYALANRAFLRAVQPQSAATARQLSDQRDQAITMLRKIQQAFRPGH